MNYTALDLETVLIADRPSVAARPPADLTVDEEASSSTGRAGVVYTGPFIPPQLVLASWAWIGAENPNLCVRLDTPDTLPTVLLNILRDPDRCLVFHNAAFDLGVIMAHYPGLRDSIMAALAAGRVHDTMVMDQLIGLARGTYDLPRFDQTSRTWSVPRLLPRKLEVLAREYCGIVLSKDPEVRLGYGQFLGRPLSDLPPRFAEYARADAAATLRVWHAQLEVLRTLNAGDGLLSEPLQTRATIVAATLDRTGVHIDRALADHLYGQFRTYEGPLRTTLAAADLGAWAPVGRPTRQRVHMYAADKAGSTWWSTDEQRRVERYRVYKNHAVHESAPARFTLSTAGLQAALEPLVPALAETPPRRADGTLSLDYDFWHANVPADHAALQTWLEYSKLQKILTTYLNLYRQTDIVFPRWHILGARTGRMSASQPSIQNVPKHRYGIRALFVPRPGQCFIKADYSWQELVTLGQAMIDVGIGRGPLYGALASGQDIHRAAAGIVLSKDPSDVTKEERQGQKALNFGVPGGLGPRKLAEYAYANYGVRWTLDEATARRNMFLDAFPDIGDYLQLMKTSPRAAIRHVAGVDHVTLAARLGLETGAAAFNVLKALLVSDNPELRAIGEVAERCNTVRLRTGRVRKFCRFTEAANTHFQGLASDVTKHAAWLCLEHDLRLVLIVHDEIVIEVPCDQQLGGFGPREHLAECMLQAFSDICPNTGPFAKVEVSGALDRWGPATDPAGKEIPT